MQGSFNGQPFTYESDLDVEQELHLARPLVVTEGTASTNLTVRILLADWFRLPSGSLVDLDTGNKGGANESLVKENIKQSMHVFEDDDEDGDED